MIAEFRAGAVLSESFRILTRNFATLFTMAVLCFAPVILLQLYQVIAYPGSLTGAEDAPVGLSLAQSFFGLATGPLLTGALSYSVFQALRGKPASIGESIGIGFRRLLPLLGVAICSGLFIMAGFIMLVIPGLIFMCMVYVASVACVAEGTGVFASMQRSRELTKGNRSAVFSILFVLGLLWGGLFFALTMAFSSSGMLVLYVIVLLAVQVVATTWNATAAVVAYYHLRSLKESIDVEDIAKVFE